MKLKYLLYLLLIPGIQLYGQDFIKSDFYLIKGFDSNDKGVTLNNFQSPVLIITDNSDDLLVSWGFIEDSQIVIYYQANTKADNKNFNLQVSSIQFDYKNKNYKIDHIEINFEYDKKSQTIGFLQELNGGGALNRKIFVEKMDKEIAATENIVYIKWKLWSVPFPM